MLSWLVGAAEIASGQTDGLSRDCWNGSNRLPQPLVVLLQPVDSLLSQFPGKLSFGKCVCARVSTCACIGIHLQVAAVPWCCGSHLWLLYVSKWRAPELFTSMPWRMMCPLEVSLAKTWRREGCLVAPGIKGWSFSPFRILLASWSYPYSGCH